MIKKLAAVTAALTIAICSFTSCSKNNDSSSTVSSTVDSSVSAVDSTTEKQTPEPSLTIDGKSIDTKDFIVCTIDGKDIDFDTFRYYYYYTISKYTSTYGATLDTIKSTDGGFKLLMEDVITALKQELVAPELAEENGIKLTDDDNKTIDDQIAKAKANYDSDEAYLNDIKSAYLTEDLYRKMLETAAIYTKVNDTLFKNNGKYATKKEDFKKIVKDTNEYCREIHVMIPFYAQVDLDDSTADSYDSMSLSDKASAKQSAYAKLDDDGVKKAKEKAKKLAEIADLVIYVVDSSRVLDDNDYEIMELIKDKKVLVILNKADLAQVTTAEDIKKIMNCETVTISAKQETGIEELEETVKNMFFNGEVKFNEDVYITSTRHKELLKKAENSLKLVLDGIDNMVSEDFLTIDLMAAYENLGLIIGEEIEDDLANRIFSKFCMGK